MALILPAFSLLICDPPVEGILGFVPFQVPSKRIFRLILLFAADVETSASIISAAAAPANNK